MKSAERFYRALGGEIPDRVPTFTLGFDTKPIVDFIMRLELWPPRLRNLYRKLHIFDDAMTTILEGGAFRVPTIGQKPLLRRVFPLENYTQFLWSMFIPTTYESIYNTLNLYLNIAVSTKTDGIVIPGWPSLRMNKFVWQTEKDGRRFRKIISDYNVATVFDEHGVPCTEDTILPPKDQIQALTEFFKNYDPTEQIQTVLKPALKKFENKIGLVCWYSPGVYETWLETHGMPHMLPYFKYLFQEYREYKHKPEYSGPFRCMLEAKTDMFIRHMKQYKELGGRAVGFAEDILTSGNAFISPDLYSEFFIPYIKKCLNTARNLGLLTVFHTDGRWKQDNQENPFIFLDIVAGCRPNGIHGFQADCNDLSECKAHLTSTRDSLHHSIVMIGGMDNNRIFSRSQPPQAVEKKTYTVLQKLKLPGPYIAATDHSYHYGTLVENIVQFNRAIWKYGLY